MSAFVRLTDAVGSPCYVWFGPGASLRTKSFLGGQSLTIIELGAEGIGVRETPEKILALIETAEAEDAA